MLWTINSDDEIIGMSNSNNSENDENYEFKLKNTCETVMRKHFPFPVAVQTDKTICELQLLLC